MRFESNPWSKLRIGLAVLVACAALPVKAQTLYRISQIPITTADHVGITSINARGDAVGFGSLGGFLYRNGVVTDLSSPVGPNARPRRINDLGDISGDNYKNTSNAFLYSVGATIELPNPPYSYGSLNDGLNNSGEATLHSVIFYPDGPVEYHASIYSHGALIRIPPIGGPYIRAYAINDLGEAVGSSSTAADEGRAFLYRGGKTIDLGSLGGSSRANDINNRSHIVGLSYLAGDAQRVAFLYKEDGIGAAKMVSLGTLVPGQSSTANAINDFDEIVGTAETTSDNQNPRAVLYVNGQVLNLNDLVDPQDPLYQKALLMNGVDINNSGLIAVNGLDVLTATPRAYLLRPVVPVR